MNILQEGLQPHRLTTGHDALNLLLVLFREVVGGFEFLCRTNDDWGVLLWVGVGD